MNAEDATPPADAVEHKEDLDNGPGETSVSASNEPASDAVPDGTSSGPATVEDASTEDGGKAKTSLTPPASKFYAFRVVRESTALPGAIAAIAGGYHGAPFDILGPHKVTVAGRERLIVRTFQPQARSVSVLAFGVEHQMQCVHAEGVFEAVFPGETGIGPYKLSITLLEGKTYEVQDGDIINFRFNV
jgi:hypothetical protein